MSAPRAAPGLGEGGASSDGSWRFNSASTKHEGADPIIKPHDRAVARNNASNTLMRTRFGLSATTEFMCALSGSSCLSVQIPRLAWSQKDAPLRKTVTNDQS